MQPRPLPLAQLLPAPETTTPSDHATSCCNPECATSSKPCEQIQPPRGGRLLYSVLGQVEAPSRRLMGLSHNDGLQLIGCLAAFESFCGPHICCKAISLLHDFALGKLFSVYSPARPAGPPRLTVNSRGQQLFGSLHADESRSRHSAAHFGDPVLILAVKSPESPGKATLLNSCVLVGLVSKSGLTVFVTL